MRPRLPRVNPEWSDRARWVGEDYLAAVRLPVFVADLRHDRRPVVDAAVQVLHHPTTLPTVVAEADRAEETVR